MIKQITFQIPVKTGEIECTLFSERSDKPTISQVDILNALANGEASIQIIEGCTYEYILTKGYVIKNSECTKCSNVNNSSGRILPGIYVGTLSIDIFKEGEAEKCGVLQLEVQSIKATYREDYRVMLEEITERCTDLILLHSSPVVQNLEPSYSKDSETLYHRFAFIKSVLDSEEFRDAIHKIISSPVTKWVDTEVDNDIRNLKKLNSGLLRQLVTNSNRICIPPSHPLAKKIGFSSVPIKVRCNSKKESTDTVENRFIKFALEAFSERVGRIKLLSSKNSKLYFEALSLETYLEQLLNHSLFKEVSNLNTIPLNSPILQRKEGYREILRVWLMFDLAAKIVWHGGDDVYKAGKRDVAVLYEYWLFFKLLDIIKEVFKIEAKELSQLIKHTKDGLGLQLKQGEHIAIKGIFQTPGRSLNIEFSFNRPFTNKNKYPEGGSWTTNMRPDYTLSIWPEAINKEEAEKEELIVHIHFDAKYKTETLEALFGEVTGSNESEEEIQAKLSFDKQDLSKGDFKQIDLLKMHAYKDAIRRTAGAYILYPGRKNNPYYKTGFHEILPGLGAFAIRPGKSNNGILELKTFLNEVVEHFLNRASQREKMSLKTYETYKDKNINRINESLPEPYGDNRALLPDETYVLVAYYKSEAHLQWIKNVGLYNTRTEAERGSLKLGQKESGAKYILLHTENETVTGKLFKIIDEGPRVFSKEKLISENYPSEPSRNFYLVYKVEEVRDKEFVDRTWDITKLDGYTIGKDSALPFAVSLTELMKVMEK